jgi:AcrR family transcriptional regulator
MLDSGNNAAYIVSEQSLTHMRPKDQTKELIARTALGLFVDKGIDGATIRDIAAAAGIAEGTLYRHYPGKDALAWELFSSNYTAFALELDRIQAGQATLRAKLDAMVRQFCAFFDDDPVLFSYLLLAQHGQLQKVTPEMPNPVEVVREVLAAGMDRGEIPAGDPNVAAAMVLGIVLQVAIFKIYQRLTQSLTSLAEVLVEACWRVLAG